MPFQREGIPIDSERGGAMELDHVFHYSNFFVAIQILFAGSLLVPATIGRLDLYRSFVRKIASSVVTVGPVGLLLYILYEVSRLS
jgi:hypothetical protein